MSGAVILTQSLLKSWFRKTCRKISQAGPSSQQVLSFPAALFWPAPVWGHRKIFWWLTATAYSKGKRDCVSTVSHFRLSFATPKKEGKKWVNLSQLVGRYKRKWCVCEKASSYWAQVLPEFMFRPHASCARARAPVCGSSSGTIIFGKKNMSRERRDAKERVFIL